MIRRIAPCLLLLAEVILFFRLNLFAGYGIPWDLRGFHLPRAYSYSDALLRGELPLWDPYTYCGRPFQANIQTAVFYPPMAAAASLGSLLGQQHLFHLLQLNVILHVFLAGLFAYWLALGLKLSLPSALLAATVYMLGGFFAAHGQHMGAVAIAAWLPLALLCALRAQAGTRLRWGLALAAVLCMTVLAGFTPLTAAVWAAAFLFVLLQHGRGRGAAWFLACCAGAVLLAAVQLLPSIELNGHSIAQYRTDWLQSGGGVPPAALLSLLIPNIHGVFDPSTYRYPFDLTFMYLYSGLLGIVLAGIGLVHLRKNWRLVLFTLIAGLAMLGDQTPLGRWLYSLLPQPVRTGLYPEFTEPVFLLGLALLAGLGSDQVLRRFTWRWAAVLLCAADLILVSSGRPMNGMPPERDPVHQRHVLDGRPETLPRLRGLAEEANPPWRFDSVTGGETFAASAPKFLLPNANGNDPMALARIIQVRLAFTRGERWGRFYEVQDPRSPVLDLLNVRFLISRDRLGAGTSTDGGLLLRGEFPGFVVYERPSALPRFWLVERVRPVQGLQQAASALRSPGFNPVQEAIVEGWGNQASSLAGPPGRVRVLRYEPGRIELETEAPHPQFLVSSEAHYPGWRAYVDGTPAPLYYTNAAFRGLSLPAGRHVVRMEFRPRTLLMGAALSLAAWIIWLLCWIRPRRRDAKLAQIGG
ncbi:MAG: YfhO family protein [Bryobacteraceae bacterium]|nr:YfhO family protein [Bryobacteraceae bacterium]